MTKLDHAKPGKIGLSEDGLERLRHILRREVEGGGLPGAVVLIARKGRAGFFETFGRRDPAGEDTMQPDAIFRIHSMTKPVVSVAAMGLVEDGRLHLTDPVARFIPAFADVTVGVETDSRLERVAPYRPILVHDLLRHTAGLTYDWVGTGAVHALYAEASLGHADGTNADHATALAALPLLHQPGTFWDYGRSTDVLGRVIEVVTGRTLGAELSRRIFEPLGMTDTGFTVLAAEQGRVAEPFAVDPDTGEAVQLGPVREDVAFENGGGGLLSTASDYARFCAMLADDGAFGKTRILARKTVELMTCNHLGPEVTVGSDLLAPGHGFGLGFAVRTAPGVAPFPGSVGTYGWFGAAGATFWVDPAEDLFALLMIQAPGRRDHYGALFRTLVYAAVD